MNEEKLCVFTFVGSLLCSVVGIIVIARVAFTQVSNSAFIILAIVASVFCGSKLGKVASYDGVGSVISCTAFFTGLTFSILTIIMCGIL